MNYDPRADTEAFWTPEDARATATFLRSIAGMKLATLLNNYSLKTAQWATEQRDYIQHSAGVAVGIGKAIDFLDKLQTISPASAQSGVTEEDFEQAALSSLAESSA